MPAHWGSIVEIRWLDGITTTDSGSCGLCSWWWTNLRCCLRGRRIHDWVTELELNRNSLFFFNTPEGYKKTFQGLSVAGRKIAKEPGGYAKSFSNFVYRFSLTFHSSPCRFRNIYSWYSILFPNISHLITREGPVITGNTGVVSGRFKGSLILHA